MIGVTDTPETMIRKIDGLTRDLDAVERGAITGKTGEMARDYDQPTPVKTEKITPGAPAVGHVEDGYRFKGGNPADQSSWEAIH